MGATEHRRASAATPATSRSRASRPAACRCSPTWSRKAHADSSTRAIVQSGAFALNQVPLANAEAFGEQFAAQVGCASETAQCLRSVPVDTLVNDFPGSAIPGVVDGKVLTEPIGTALAAGRFAHVPVINGINTDEELLFVAGLHLAVSGGTFVPVPQPVNDSTYESVIASVLGVSAARACSDRRGVSARRVRIERLEH